MALKRFPLVAGDRLPEITATVRDAAGAAVSLVGATVAFFMADKETGTVKIDGAAATVVDAAGGQVKYAWGATDTTTAGEYRARFRVTFGDGRKMHAPNYGYVFVTISPKQGT